MPELEVQEDLSEARMRSVLLKSASVCQGRQLFTKPSSSCCKKRVATMTYNAFSFEVYGKVKNQ